MSSVATTEDFELGPIMGMMMAVMMAAMMMAILPQPVVAETANLSGHIRDTEGDPVDGAQLSLNSLLYTTGSNGYYEFTDLTLGVLSLVVVNAEDLGYEYKPPISVNLAAGDNVKDIILTTPIAETKANLVGVVRHYTTLDLMDGVAITLNSHEATTNVYGLYSFHDVEPGDYTLTVSKSGFNTKTIDVTLVAGDNTLDIMLVPEGIPAAEFEVSDLIIIPAEVNVGEAVEISAMVTNTGDAAGTYTAGCDITPATYTPLEVIPVAIPWETIISMMMLTMFMSIVVKTAGK